MDFIKERKSVVLLNKSDLESVVSADEVEKRSGHKVIGISAKEETGNRPPGRGDKVLIL